MKIKRHQIINVTEGEYDDYEIVGSYRALHGFDTDAVLEEYLQIHPDFILPAAFKMKLFLDWIVELSYVKEIEVEDWHIAEYDTVLRDGKVEFGILDERDLVEGYEVPVDPNNLQSATSLPGDEADTPLEQGEIEAKWCRRFCKNGRKTLYARFIILLIRLHIMTEVKDEEHNETRGL